MSPSPTRITIAFSGGEDSTLKKLKDEESVSTSEIIRRAVKFYSRYRYALQGDTDRKMKTYLDMLPKGEHVILDIEHWILFMKMVQELPEDDEFWGSCERIAEDHAEEFRGKHVSPQAVFERFEDCNFFRLQKNSEKEFTLVLNSENSRRFVEFATKRLLSAMGYKAEYKASLGKIRVKLHD